jgi:pyruvate kinase
MFTHTKIVCTIGPAVNTLEKMIELINAGMNVARLNFSHGTHEEHLKTIDNLKLAREKMQVPLAIMLDTKGPEIRIGKITGDVVQVKPGMRLKIAEKGPDAIPVHPFEALDLVQVGTNVLFDDGYITSKTVERNAKYIVVEVQNSGTLKSGKKVNVPGVRIPLPAMTKEDIADLKFGCKHDVDLIAASFIRSAHHVLAIKELLAKEGKPDILVISKIESTEGVENFDSIMQVSDGIMVARGDLGVEVDLALVPKLQKMMIRKCYMAGKSVVTATQMLESMIVNPRPTRAEVSDVANAIYDSTSAVMLSGETAAGKYPIEAVQRMKSIVREAEADFNYREFFEQRKSRDYHDASAAVSIAAVQTAYSANARAIFAFTSSGRTARLVSRLRPGIPIFALTRNKKVYEQLSSNWGIVPVYCPTCSNNREAFHATTVFALALGMISFGDVVVVTAGMPFGKKGTTNMMLLENIGDVLVRGNKGLGKKVFGKVATLLSAESISPESLRDAIVVISHCDDTFLPVLKHASGIILQNYIEDTASEKYAEVIAKAYNIPVITRADAAMDVLQDGDEITLDPHRGLVYSGTEEHPTSRLIGLE